MELSNKQAWAIASSVMATLSKNKLLSDKAKENKAKGCKELINQAIQSTNLPIEKQPNTKEKEEELELSLRLANDPAFARGWYIKEMVRQTKGNNATSAKELRDVLGIAHEDEGLTVELVDYSNAVIDCPHCGENLSKPPELPPLDIAE